MKKIFTSTLLAASLFFGFAASASAEMPVNLVQPADWSIDNSENSDRRIVVYVDPKTDSRIEVLACDLVREGNAEALFEAFHSQLIQNNFNAAVPASPREFNLSDSKKRTGTWTEYSFGSADVPIDIVTYSFTVNNMALIVVGYFASANRASGIETMKTAIMNMTDKL